MAYTRGVWLYDINTCTCTVFYIHVFLEGYKGLWLKGNSGRGWGWLTRASTVFTVIFPGKRRAPVKASVTEAQLPVVVKNTVFHDILYSNGSARVAPVKAGKCERIHSTFTRFYRSD